MNVPGMSRVPGIGWLSFKGKGRAFLLNSPEKQKNLALFVHFHL
jgi:hypothetical protein